MKQWIFGMLAVALILLAGCGMSEEEKLAKQELEVRLSVFSDGDMEDINEAVFGPQSTEEAAQDGGFLAELFAMSEVQVLKVDSDSVTLQVTAPDMSGFFASDLSNVDSERELSDAILDYAMDAKKIKTELTMDCTGDGSRLKPDFQDPAFLDALSGGLLTAYGALMDQLLGALEG